MNQLGEMLMGMRKQMEANTRKMEGMENKMDTNTKEMKGEMKEMRGEMQKMGHGLQAGMKAITCSKAQTARRKWRRHVLGRTSWRGVHRRVRTG